MQSSPNRILAHSGGAREGFSSRFETLLLPEPPPSSEAGQRQDSVRSAVRPRAARPPPPARQGEGAGRQQRDSPSSANRDRLPAAVFWRKTRATVTTKWLKLSDVRETIIMFNVPSPFLNLNHRYMAILASDANSEVYSALEFNLVRLVSSQPEQT